MHHVHVRVHATIIFSTTFGPLTTLVQGCRLHAERQGDPHFGCLVQYKVGPWENDSPIRQ